MNLEFKIMLMFILLSLLISGLISIMSFILTYKNPNKEKVTVYECGFNPFHSPGEPFSMSFFLIAMLFLVFDLEISYLFPWSMNSNLMNYYGQIMMMMFIMMLMIGLIYEWISGGLEWE